MSWTAFKILLGMKIALAEYSMIEKHFVLLLILECPYAHGDVFYVGLVREYCVFMHISSTFLIINVALKTGPHRRKRGAALCQEGHMS